MKTISFIKSPLLPLLLFIASVSSYGQNTIPRIVPLQYNHPDGSYYISRNGGISWTYKGMPAPTEDIATIRLVENGTVYHSSDGGETWVAEYQDGTTNPLLHSLARSGSASFSVNVAPNPVHETASIRYEVEEPQHLTLTLVDMLGREVQIFSGVRIKGSYEVTFDATAYPPGLYFLRLSSTTTTTMNTLVIQR